MKPCRDQARLSSLVNKQVGCTPIPQQYPKLWYKQRAESPKRVSWQIWPRDLAWAPAYFPLFFRLLDWNNEDYAAQSCPRVNSEHILVLLRRSLTVWNPDFTGVTQKPVISYVSHVVFIYNVQCKWRLHEIHMILQTFGLLQWSLEVCNYYNDNNIQEVRTSDLRIILTTIEKQHL